MGDLIPDLLMKGMYSDSGRKLLRILSHIVLTHTIWLELMTVLFHSWDALLHFHMTIPKENLLRRLLSHVLILFLAVLALPVAQPAGDDDEDEGMLNAGNHS